MFKRIVLSFIIICFLTTSVTAAGEKKNDIIAKGYVLIEASTGRVIRGLNENEKLPMASTTKIMTALIALEQPNINEYFEVNETAIKVEGTSMGLQKGDKASFFALANGMLMASGNDAANAAAVKIGGSISGFAKIMNNRAAKMSLKNTNFVTPSGLNDENHYSTAYDMAILGREALKNTMFASICQRTKAQIEYGNPPYKRTLSNHNRLLTEYDGCIGIKTGFTKKAGRCLVSAATRDGVTLICVTLNAANDWQVHKDLFDYGFENVKKTKIDVSVDGISINIVGGVNKKSSVKTHIETTAPINSDEVKLLTKQVYINKFYYAPIREGDIVGEIKHYLNGNEVATTTLLANENIQQIERSNKKSFWQKVKEFLLIK